MQHNFKFRAGLKTKQHSIIVPVELIFPSSYQIDIYWCDKIFKKNIRMRIFGIL